MDKLKSTLRVEQFCDEEKLLTKMRLLTVYTNYVMHLFLKKAE